jgi:hypothetical protein
MRVSLVKDTHSVTDDMTVTKATVRHLTCKFEGSRHKVFMDNLFSPPGLFDYLDRRKINSCGRVLPKRKDMPYDFGTK